MLQGEPVSYHDDREDQPDDEKLSVGCFAISPTGETLMGDRRDPFINATPGSTAVIGISGPIMKYDNCGDPGTKSYGALLTKARKNSNITSVLLVVDSPGGTVDGTQELADAVKSFSKPIVALVDGMACSAAYWIASSADEIIANNETATIGSIGTMLSFADVQGYWEKKGVKFHYIYADASTDKNKGFHDAQKGDYTIVKRELNTINNLFVGAVKANRPGIKETALSGKTFLGSEAVAQGLIDSVGSFDRAIERAQSLAGIRPKETTSTQKQNLNMKKVSLTAAHAALLAVCGVTLAAGQDSVEVDLDALNAAVAKSAETLKAAQDEVATAKTNATELEARAMKAEGELEELGKKNAGASAAVKNGDDAIEGEDAEASFETDMDIEARKRRTAMYGN